MKRSVSSLPLASPAAKPREEEIRMPSRVSAYSAPLPRPTNCASRGPWPTFGSKSTGNSPMDRGLRAVKGGVALGAKIDDARIGAVRRSIVRGGRAAGAGDAMFSATPTPGATDPATFAAAGGTLCGRCNCVHHPHTANNTSSASAAATHTHVPFERIRALHRLTSPCRGPFGRGFARDELWRPIFPEGCC